ncbi:MAG: type II toxin-antitoxin system VapC family toxin [Chthoniobacterales bacterium]
MGFLLDTNIIFEIRKGSRCDSAVSSWYADVAADELWLSVLVIGEIRQGIERTRRKDPISAAHLESWLVGLSSSYQGRILPVSLAIAHRWGVLNSLTPISYIDGYLAATALEHELTLVT